MSCETAARVSLLGPEHQRNVVLDAGQQISAAGLQRVVSAVPSTGSVTLNTQYTLMSHHFPSGSSGFFHISRRFLVAEAEQC